ncbi:PRC-barrel domain-containing protein [Luteolibacter sp. LG18]|uniref:PRC-barrel domain-containing protein n=1 Tax=Luteolibacter sp. LG18 TaxID=2819286 RepID=UPI0030C6FEF7
MPQLPFTRVNQRNQKDDYMLRNLEELDGNKLIATDGPIGHVRDFYFDDETWIIRYLVADAGDWLPGREVLLSPHALGDHDRDGRVLHVNLSRRQIEESPPIELHQPVTREFEKDYYDYYGWPPYWKGGAMWGEIGFPLPYLPRSVAVSLRHSRREDPVHLRGTEAITGYNIHATNGPIGAVSSFVVDDQSWAIGALVLEAGYWFSSKEILIPICNLDRINDDESTVYLNLPKEKIQVTSRNGGVRTAT